MRCIRFSGEGSSGRILAIRVRTWFLAYAELEGFLGMVFGFHISFCVYRVLIGSLFVEGIL